MWFGNTTILLMAGMMGIDPALFEAARGRWCDIDTGILPHHDCRCCDQFLVYVLITSLIGGLQMFDVPQILTNGSGEPMQLLP